MRIILLQLASFGDCLYATNVARQIKHDYPGCHLTWCIGSICVSVLYGNDNIDSIHVIPLNSISEAWNEGWKEACIWAERELSAGNVDLIVKTQILPDNIHHYDGLIRSTIYRGYANKITCGHRPCAQVSNVSISQVEQFCISAGFDNYKHRFLFECGPRSGQSSMNPDSAELLSHHLASLFPDVLFILSSTQPLKNPTQQVIDASSLTFMQNAALANRCTGLIGCSSGITWLTTSEFCQPLPMLQVVTSSTSPFAFASVITDFERYHLNEHLCIEIVDATTNDIILCLTEWIENGHTSAKLKFGNPASLSKNHLTEVFQLLLRKLGMWTALCTMLNFARSHGTQLLPIKIILKTILNRLSPRSLLRRLSSRTVLHS
jgi:hypothetical protein